jgi:hypothetical protein
MLQIEFSQNFSGQIFPDFFQDVRLNEEGLYAGNMFDGYLKSIRFGYVRIVSVRIFSYSKINDTISYMAIGKPAAALALHIKNKHGNIIKPDTQLALITWENVERNFETQGDLLQDWWQNKKKDRI